MRRFAALLSFVALAQSAVLRTGVLCDGADAGSAGASQMPGMDMGATAHEASRVAPSAGVEGDERGARHHDRSHDGAHCPLMANCVVAAVRVPPIDVTSASRPVVVVSSAPESVPRSETRTPEPPPPKG